MNAETAVETQSELLEQEIPQHTAQLPAAQSTAYPAGPGDPFHSEAANLLAGITLAAADPSFDMDRLDKLLALRKEILNEESTKEYAKAMSRAQGNIGVIVKNQFNTHTKSKYADMAAINAQLVKSYSAEGFALSFSVEPSTIPDHLCVIADVMHSAGHVKRYRRDLPYDGKGQQGNTNKTPLHANASTGSYGQRYLLQQIFNIAAEDDDGNGNQRPAQQPQQQPEGKPPYHQEEFNKNWDAWEATCKAGKSSRQRITSFLNSKYTLSAEQLASLAELPNAEAGEAQ